MAANVFEAVNLTKKYGDFFALDKVSMTIRRGEIYGLVGENGAGKTTLMKVIGGLIHPSSGNISLFGQTNADFMNKARRKIGYLIEMPALYPDLSAKDNLEFYCHMFNVTDKNVISSVLREVSLDDTGEKRVEDFSLGMRQRLGLAIALINNPEFLVLDEPINGLDPSGIVQVREILKKLAVNKGTTILISSHILSELQMIAERFGFIHRGSLISEITSGELSEAGQKYVCIKASNPSVALQVIQDTFHITVVSRYGGEEICIPVEKVSLENIISVLIKSNIEIQNISTSSPNLENYYMNLIRGENK